MSTRYLYLLRHTKSDRPPHIEDFDRGLSERGVRDAGLVAEAMSDHDLVPDMALCSSAKRTKQTLDPIRRTWAEMDVSYREDLYLASAGQIYEAVKDVPDDYRNVLVVGHNPGMHDFVRFLTKDGDRDAIQKTALGYKTGALSVFACPCERWADLMPAENILEKLLIGKELAEE